LKNARARDARPDGGPQCSSELCIEAPIAETGLRRQIGALLPELRAFARFLARDRTVADDLVQDAVMRALAALHQFQAGTSLKAWLFTILRNAFYEQQRRRRRENAAIAATFDLSEMAMPAQDAQSEINDLQHLIWTLPPLLREALILVGAQELSHEEAALVCNVPVGTMKARLSRARVALSAAVRSAERSG
jgi:RNA polymerase sigma-70 factor (ECF subfamily)